MNVLQIVEPGVDGVFRHVEGLTDYLLAQGVKVHLAYSDVRSSDRLFQLVARVQAAGGQTLNLKVGNFPGPRDVSALLGLLRLVRSVPLNVIHGHSSKAGVLSRALAVLGVRARYFYTPNAYFQMYGQPNLKRKVFQLIESALGRIGTTINVSASEAEYARRELHLPAERQEIFPNCVDGTRFHPPADAAAQRGIRARLGLPEDALLLGTVGRFSEQKDPITTYTALCTVLPRIPSLHFVHLGQGDLSVAVDELLATAPDEVRSRVHRIASMKDTAEFYRALDGFVLASRYEGLSLAVLEAAATDLPLILSRCPGSVDFETSGMNRMRWVAPCDPAGLGEQIAAWAVEASAKNASGCNNHRQIILEKFSESACFSQILRSYTR